MSVYKPSGYNNHIIKLRIGNRQEKFPGVTDKGVSRAIERNIRRLAGIKSSHDAMPVELSSWLAELPERLPKLHDRLMEVGLLDRGNVEAGRPLLEHLDGVIEPLPRFNKMVPTYIRTGATEEDARRRVVVLHPELYVVKQPGYLQHLLAKGNTSDYIALTISRIRAMLNGCSFSRIADFDPARLEGWLAQQRREGMGITTSNHHLRAMKSFAHWLLHETLKRRHDPNPFENIKPLDNDTDIRRQRRNPTNAELAALLATTAQAPEYRGLSGEDRAMLYRMALATGLRANELQSLTPESFHLNGEHSIVTVQAASSKHRQKDVLPLHPHFVQQLRPWLESRTAGKQLWPGSWIWGPAKMLREDLERAGIEYEVGGAFFDFHAQRHGAISRGAKTITNPKTLQSFARHSKIEMTMKYLHIDADELAEAVATIPALPGTTPDPMPAVHLPGVRDADHSHAKTNPDPVQTASPLIPKSDQKSDQAVVLNEGGVVLGGHRGQIPLDPQKHTNPSV